MKIVCIPYILRNHEPMQNMEAAICDIPVAALMVYVMKR